MQKLFFEVNSLDKRCYDQLALTEDLLMEHAAQSMASYIQQHHADKQSVLIVCGGGNNGADGLALARLLHKRFEVLLYCAIEPRSDMAKLQYKRVERLGIKPITEIIDADIVVDCLFGSGLNREISEEKQKLLQAMNALQAVKIACDIPSGINMKGQLCGAVFEADMTITMGALKTALYSDCAKNYVGHIEVADLGVQRAEYELDSKIHVLEASDLELPIRSQQDAHKGSYGHLHVVAGDKCGAAIMAAQAASCFGTGLVTIVSHKELFVPYHLMQSKTISENCSALAIGMGMGERNANALRSWLAKPFPKVIDADMFYEPVLIEFLKDDTVLTPHPKEFCSLLKLAGIASIDTKTLQQNRLHYAQLFCEKYPDVVLLLKGANVIIGKHHHFYINPLGTVALSKGGSGDVLTGMIAALLAQSYNPLKATINASLAHSLAARNYDKHNYALTPNDLIEGIKTL